ncbi:MAG: hypothetical protein A2521_00645 [Deltaproteobacteria bacterium RIFOXYD12_FULL_57_12]|nr:MAG: hypothetical protein A2521_00645 [Deltaproteobacteria bacterium RIFOXYD12_FULL_57_12]
MTSASQKRQKKRLAPNSYRKRTYRALVESNGLVSSQVTVRETDLQILAPRDVTTQAYDLVYHYRNQLENYIATHPAFLTSLAPLPADPLAPPIVKAMLKAGQVAAVGPMAAVAGAVAEFVGRDLLAGGLDEVMVENGGDIFLMRTRECVSAIFAGPSPLSQRVGLRIAAADMPLGLCTSSGTVGHSLSLGTADAVTVLAASASLADAVATLVGNAVQDEQTMGAALELAQTIPGIMGVVIIKNEQLGAWGKVDLVKIA